MDNPKSSPYFNAEMDGYTDEYVAYVLELLENAKKTCPDPVIYIEQQVDFSRFVPDGFGTADTLLIFDKTIHIVDLKYGRGVPVSAIDNPQMKLYALGALEMFDCLYDIERIDMTIFQPRLSNISTFSITKEELVKWAEEVVRPIAALAYEGKGEFCPSEECRFCKAKSTCRARAKALMELEEMNHKEPPLLTDEEVEEVLGKVESLVSWANEVKDYALAEAIRGKRWTNYKLVEGRSNRKYSDEKAVADAVVAAGLDPYKEPELLSITELQKKIGKERFAELVESYVVKPSGKPCLVLRTDKREEINSAATDFADAND